MQLFRHACMHAISRYVKMSWVSRGYIGCVVVKRCTYIIIQIKSYVHVWTRASLIRRADLISVLWQRLNKRKKNRKRRAGSRRMCTGHHQCTCSGAAMYRGVRVSGESDRAPRGHDLATPRFSSGCGARSGPGRTTQLECRTGPAGSVYERGCVGAVHGMIIDTYVTKASIMMT